MRRLPGDSYRFSPDVSMDYTGTLPDNSAASDVIQTWDFTSPQSFLEDTCRILCDSSGPASHAAPPILAKRPCTIPCLATVMFSFQGNLPLLQNCGPLENLSPVSVSHPIGTDLQKEVVMTGASNSGWGHCTRTNRRSAPGQTNHFEMMAVFLKRKY